MNKKLAHTIFLIGDFLFIWILWIGFNDFKHVLSEIANRADTIEFNSRSGFFIVCIGLPLIHLLSVIDYVFPGFPKKFHRLVNIGLIFFVIALLSTGFVSSSWLRFQVENASYFYCRNASGVSALARTLVYTKNMGVCETLVNDKRKQR